MAAESTSRSGPVAPVAAVRDVDIGGDRRLVVRPVEPVDVGALTELYDQLDEDSRRRRFFSAYRPDREFFHHLVAAEERGGAELVAEVHGPGHAEQVVGEAGFELLPNGDGELAIVVAEGWRGWLGPFLLDALLEVAAARGVPNLEADVLAINHQMLALARARGMATIPQQDWSVRRIVIGAASRDPGWPTAHDRPRVLVEGVGVRWPPHEAAEAAGLDVVACSGPTSRRRCPALEGRACPLVAGTDAVVLASPPDDPEWDRLRAAHPVLHGAVPVCVELRDDDRAREGEEALPDVPAVDLVAIVTDRARGAPDPGRAGDET
jgi:RimJ/RimL family protein N-acetyltransferase